MLKSEHGTTLAILYLFQVPVYSFGLGPAPAAGPGLTEVETPAADGADHPDGVLSTMTIPTHLRYTAEHEWLDVTDDGLARVGITAFAQDQLGDVVYVDVPAAGATVRAGKPFGVVESVKAASDLYSPLTGTVVEVNGQLVDHPELVNADPYGEGWMVVVRPADAAELDGLLDAAAYAALTAEG